MTNAERIARDLGFLVGQYERGEITASNLCIKAEELTRASCEHCVGTTNTIFCDATCTCDGGFAAYLEEEAT